MKCKDFDWGRNPLQSGRMILIKMSIGIPANAVPLNSRNPLQSGRMILIVSYGKIINLPEAKSNVAIPYNQVG